MIHFEPYAFQLPRIRPRKKLSSCLSIEIITHDASRLRPLLSDLFKSLSASGRSAPLAGCLTQLASPTLTRDSLVASTRLNIFYLAAPRLESLESERLLVMGIFVRLPFCGSTFHKLSIPPLSL